jgi:hypothetical protein
MVFDVSENISIFTLHLFLPTVTQQAEFCHHHVSKAYVYVLIVNVFNGSSTI